jgi:hypothetical protein
MPLKTELLKATRAILEYQNPDGGIPATNPGDNSGAWTTASCLESFLECSYSSFEDYQKIKKMINYLLDNQLADGGWPMVDSDASCTMATGHAVSSFILSQKAYEEDVELIKKISLSMTRGFRWLANHQNQDGGWGIEPSGGIDGQLTRIAATAYALRPYWTQGVKFDDSKVVRDGISYFEKTQRNEDGGWAYAKGETRDDYSDPSNTARAVISILKSGHLDSQSPQIVRALSFIKSQKLAGSSWKLGIEGFLLESTHSQNIYHNNGPCDALEALLVAHDNSLDTIEGFLWLLKSQKDNGVWHLSSPDPQQKFAHVWTWSTSEFVYVINLASVNLFRYLVNQIMMESVRPNNRPRTITQVIRTALGLNSQKNK